MPFRLAAITVRWKDIVLHETMSKSCAKLMKRSLCSAHQSLESSWRFGSDLVRQASLWAVSYKDGGKPSFCVNRGWRLRSPGRGERPPLGGHRSNGTKETRKSNPCFVSPPLLRLTPEDVQCAGSPCLTQGHESVSVESLPSLSLSFSWKVCPPELLEGWRRSLYPSICTVGSNSEVNNSLYKGGKWSRTISGYIALNAMSFSVCRPHRALKVDTLHISCGGNRGRVSEGLGHYFPEGEGASREEP